MQRSGQRSNRVVWAPRCCLIGVLLLALVSGLSRVYADSQTPSAQSNRNQSDSELVVRVDKDNRGENGKPFRFPSRRTFAGQSFEVVAELDVRPIGLAVGSDDRLFISLAAHLGDTPQKDGVIVRELLLDGSLTPFPATSSSEIASSAESFTKVLALSTDSRGIVWILDSGAPPVAEPKLVGWDTKKDALHRLVYLPAPITKSNSSLVSVSIDEKRDFAYIADQGRSDFVGKSESAIISVDLRTGAAWRALEDHYSLNADGGDFIVKGEPLLAPDGKGSLVRPSLGIAAVAYEEREGYLYFGAANGRSVFRIAAEALSDPNLSSAQVGERVERLGDKPPSHGLFVRAPGQVLISDVNNNGIGIVGPTGTYESLANATELSWPTAFARGSRGEVYVVSSQFHRAPLFHRGEDQSKRPFLIARFYPQLVRQAPQKNQTRVDPKKGQTRR